MAALASYLDARSRNGTWLPRIEDIDQARCIPGAADEIIRMLADFALEMGRADRHQSHATSQQRYRQRWSDSHRAGDLPCGCSRKEIADLVANRYRRADLPGTCRAGLPLGKLPRAVRLRVADGDFGCEDRVQGWVSQNLAQQIGDFVLEACRRRVFHQLAVVVDDAWRASPISCVALTCWHPLRASYTRSVASGAARGCAAASPLAVNQYGPS